MYIDVDVGLGFSVHLCRAIKIAAAGLYPFSSLTVIVLSGDNLSFLQGVYCDSHPWGCDSYSVDPLQKKDYLNQKTLHCKRRFDTL